MTTEPDVMRVGISGTRTDVTSFHTRFARGFCWWILLLGRWANANLHLKDAIFNDWLATVSAVGSEDTLCPSQAKVSFCVLDLQNIRVDNQTDSFGSGRGVDLSSLHLLCLHQRDTTGRHTNDIPVSECCFFSEHSSRTVIFIECTPSVLWCISSCLNVSWSLSNPTALPTRFSWGLGTCSQYSYL